MQSNFKDRSLGGKVEHICDMFKLHKGTYYHHDSIKWSDLIHKHLFQHFVYIQVRHFF